MRVAIVGAGIAGVAAARAALALGCEVTILESSHSPGGLMARLANCRVGFKTFLDVIKGHPNLDLLTGVTIDEVSSREGTFELALQDGRKVYAENVIIAVGAIPYEPRKRGRRVLASLEYDALIDQTRERLPQDLERVAFVLCVGSRSKDYPLCSSVCCSYTLRQIKWTLQRADPRITVFYNDLRLFGQEFFMEKALRERGVRFLRTNSRGFDEIEEGVKVRYHFGGRIREEVFDYVVLSCGLRPSPSLPRLSELFGFSLNEFGFVKEASTLSTTREGVYACGCALEPMTIKDSIMTGLGAGFLASGRRGDWRHYVYREDGPEIRMVEDRAKRYLFYLGTEDPFVAYFYEYFSPRLIELARQTRRQGKEVFFVTRNVVMPSYSELLYEEARREGIVFIHLEEGEEAHLEQGGMRAGDRWIQADKVLDLEELCRPLHDRMFLSLYRSEPQIRWSPTRWQRRKYYAGFIRHPRDGRWEEREYLCAEAEAAIDECEERSIPKVDEGRCSGCGICEKACPSAAITLSFIEAPIPVFGPEMRARYAVATVKEGSCLGCGLCASLCPSDAVGFGHP